MLELVSVSKRFGGGAAVEGVSLAVRPGEFFSLLGPSGCGKTTLLRIAAGFERADGGAVKLGGKDVTGLPPYRRSCNLVFQRYALFPHLDVFANVAFGPRMAKVPKAEVHSRVAAALDLVSMTGFERRAVETLSGGQQQRVAIARAVVNRPEVLLLDEPLSALDLKLRQRMQVELLALQRRLQITFVYVTHAQDEALTLSDRVAVMNAGRIEQIGTPREIYQRPATPFVASFIGQTNRLLIPAASGGGGASTLLLRPEMLKLGLAEGQSPAETGTLSVKVERTLFKGSYQELHARLGDVSIVAHLPADQAAPLPGATVTLAYKKSDALTMAGEVPP